MADEISIGKQAIKEVQDLRAELVKLSEDALKAGKNLSSISTPGALNKNGADNAKLGAELDAFKTKYASLNDTIVKKAEQSRLAEIRLQQQREKAFDSFEKNAQKEEAALKKAEGNYQRLQNSVNLMTKAYNDLAVRKQLGGTLTDKEEKQLESLQKRISDYNAVLLKVDSTIGKNQRNVGNYASGYNALGNSINQLTREAPAFANSLNTGFMAISNNIPALTDAISGIRKQNELLRAEGKPTQSVLSQLAGAFFSWQTAISLGVTLLTVYGAKLVDMAFNTNTAEKALESFNRKQERFNSLIEQSNKNIDHQATLQKEQIKRQLAINELQSAGKETTEKNIQNQLIAQSKLMDLDENALRQKLSNAKTVNDSNKKAYETELENIKGKITAEADAQNRRFMTEEQLQELKKKGLGKELTNKLNEALADNKLFQEKKKAFEKSNSDVNQLSFALGEKLAENNTKQIENEATALEQKLKLQDDYQKNLAEMNKAELQLALEKNSALLNNEDSYYSDRITALKDNLAIRMQIAKLDYDEDIRQAKDSQEKKKTAYFNYQAEIFKITQDGIKKRADLEKLDLDAITKLTNVFSREDLLKPLEKSAQSANKELQKSAEHAEKVRLKLLELQGETNNWLKSFDSEFLQNSGFGSLQTFFDGTFNALLAGAETTQEKFAVTFNAIAESAQEVFNFISNASQKNFDKEKERLQNQYDTALSYAGDNKAAQEKLAEDLEKSKKDIANREAKAKQKQAIFNIAIDTAQAIVSALASVPPNVPLSIAIGAIGAAQIALVASQEIPKYWMGGTHDGGLMMVNDGQGSNYRETIVTPDGNIHKPQGRNVIMNAPVGTEIFTHEQWNNELQNMLQGKGISMSMPQMNKGITKDELEDVFVRTLGNQPQSYTNFDGNGVTSYIQKRGNITRTNINRSNGKGIRYGL